MYVCVGRQKFERLWCDLLPHISAMKPATDLCEICHLNFVKITRSCNLPESEKSKQLQEAEHHLELAKVERELYNHEYNLEELKLFKEGRCQIAETYLVCGTEDCLCNAKYCNDHCRAKEKSFESKHYSF